MTIPFVRANGGGREDVSTIAVSGSALPIDLADGNVHDVTLSENCTLSFTGQVAGVACGFTLILRQDATGSRLVTWPAAVEWPGGSAPSLSSASSAVDILTFFTVNNGTTWYGSYQLAMA